MKKIAVYLNASTDQLLKELSKHRFFSMWKEQLNESKVVKQTGSEKTIRISNFYRDSVPFEFTVKLRKWLEQNKGRFNINAYEVERGAGYVDVVLK